MLILASFVPVTLFHYVLEGWAQLSAWQKMKSLIVIWASLITHLTQLKCRSKEVKLNNREQLHPHFAGKRTRWATLSVISRAGGREVNSYWQAGQAEVTLHL